MRGKLEAYATETLCVVMYQARFPINELLRKTVSDRHVEELLEFSFSFHVPQRVWDEVDRYLNDRGSMPKWDICQNKMVFQSIGREAVITFRQQFSKEQMSLKDGLYFSELSISPSVTGQIGLRPAFFIPISGTGGSDVIDEPTTPPKKKENGGNQPHSRSNNPRKCCDNCLLLNSGNLCAIHKTKVTPDHSCSRFHPVRIYYGGAVSPK